jgi:hypothetical protein
MRAAMFHPCPFAGLLHRGQQIPVAQVLAGLCGEHVRAAGDHLCFQVLNGFHRPGVEWNCSLTGRRLGGALDEVLPVYPAIQGFCSMGDFFMASIR